MPPPTGVVSGPLMPTSCLRNVSCASSRVAGEKRQQLVSPRCAAPTSVPPPAPPAEAPTPLMDTAPGLHPSNDDTDDSSGASRRAWSAAAAARAATAATCRAGCPGCRRTSVSAGSHWPVWLNAFSPASTSSHSIFFLPPYALSTCRRKHSLQKVVSECARMSPRRHREGLASTGRSGRTAESRTCLEARQMSGPVPSPCSAGACTTNTIRCATAPGATCVRVAHLDEGNDRVVRNLQHAAAADGDVGRGARSARGNRRG